MAKTATKTTAAKKAPARAAASKTTVAKKAPAKKAVAKKSAAKKAPAKKATSTSTSKESGMAKELKVGTPVQVRVNPRENGGSDVAAGLVTKAGEETVNVTVFLDSEANQWLRNVAVVKSEPKDDEDSAETGTQRVCWTV